MRLSGFLFLLLFLWTVSAVFAQSSGWEQIRVDNLPLTHARIQSYCGALFTKRPEGLYRSNDAGSSWALVAMPTGLDYDFLPTGIWGNKVDPTGSNQDTHYFDFSVYRYGCSSNSFLPVLSFSGSTYWHGCSDGAGVREDRGMARWGRYQTCIYQGINTATQHFERVEGPSLTRYYAGGAWQAGGSPSNIGSPVSWVYQVEQDDSVSGASMFVHRFIGAGDTLAMELPDAVGATYASDTLRYATGDSIYTRAVTDSLWTTVAAPFGAQLAYDTIAGTRQYLATSSSVYTGAREAAPATYELLFESSSIGSAFTQVTYRAGYFFVTAATGITYRFDAEGQLIGSTSISTSLALDDLEITPAGPRVRSAGNDWFLLDNDGEATLNNYAEDTPRPVYSVGQFMLTETGTYGYRTYRLLRTVGGQVDSLFAQNALRFDLYYRRGAFQAYRFFAAQPRLRYSLNDGDSWQSYVLDDNTRQFAADAEGNWLRLRWGQLEISADQGATWTPTGLTSVQALHHFSTGVFVVLGQPNQGVRYAKWSGNTQTVTPLAEIPEIPPFFDQRGADQIGPHYQVERVVTNTGGSPRIVLFGDQPATAKLLPPAPFSSSYSFPPYSTPLYYTTASAGRKYGRYDDYMYALSDQGIWRIPFCELKNIDSVIPVLSVDCTDELPPLPFETILIDEDGCEVAVQYTAVADTLRFEWCKANRPFYYAGQRYDSSGVFLLPSTYDGCLIEQALVLDMKSPPEIHVDGTFCAEEQSFAYRGEYYSQPGTYYQDQSGTYCDTVFVINVERLATAATYDTIAVAPGTMLGDIAVNVPMQLEDRFEMAASNGCDSVRYTWVELLTSVDKSYEKEKISIYPNPVDDVLTIAHRSSQTGGIETIAIYAASGRCMDRCSSVENSVEFRVEDYPSGVYWVRVQTNAGVSWRSVVVE